MALTPRLTGRFVLPAATSEAAVAAAVTALRDALTAMRATRAVVCAARHGDDWAIGVDATLALGDRDAAYAWVRERLGAGRLLERGRVAVHLCSHAAGEASGVEHCRAAGASAYAETVA